MKTIRFYTAIMIILALTFTTSLIASTHMISSKVNPPETALTNFPLDIEHINEFDFEEEAYIDDIPFDTECVSTNCIYQKAILLAYDFEEEAYVDDIPFATDSVVMNNEFNFEDESYIDDIPFNTKKIAKHSNRNQFVYNR